MYTRRPNQIRIGLALVAVLAGLLLSPSANAQSVVREVPSTIWGHTFAGPTGKNISSTPTNSKHLDAKSNFIVNYTDFPAWAKIDIQSAIDIWSANFVSTTPITVDASWGRSSTNGILGSARPGDYFSNFQGAPDPTLWYPSALANALAGQDLDKTSSEIVIQVNSAANWDQRNDRAPTTSEYDLESVFIHEIAHGLGFLSTDSYDTFFKYGIIDQPTAFDAYAQTPDSRRLSDLPSPSLELGQALTNTLVWSGPLGVKANSGVKPLLYTPHQYQDGSSVSHLDEATYSSSGADSVMTPNLDAGEVFQGPGPLLLAMMEDLRNKPPVGLSFALPEVPRNAIALIGDRSVVISFDPPANVRTAQVTSYTIKNNKTQALTTAYRSPVVIAGLTNGMSYNFSIIANNSLGQSDAVLTNTVSPEPAWKAKVLDPLADGKYMATTTFRNQPAIVYTDSAHQDLKLALWTGKVWRTVTVDGKGGTAGRTSHNVAGPVSVCISGEGTKAIMQIFYSDLVDKDLRHATYDNSNFKFEIVDGNGPSIQPYDQLNRVRTASDVSVSNACAVTSAGLQVFYRDDSQGILLGAVKGSSGKWVYEIVDGDRKTGNRTSGDIAFHLSAVAVGSKVSVLYDSVLGLNQQRQVAAGEIRLATRSTSFVKDWTYRTLDTPGLGIAVVGYEVSLNRTAAGTIASWLTATSISIPKPNQLRWVNLNAPTAIVTVNTGNFGAPTAPLSADNKTLAFGCEGRLCSLDLNAQSAKPKIKLISNPINLDRVQNVWVTVNKVRYAVATVAGKITLLRP
ncbi:MAG TPA: hypothetical protein VF307_06495 [Candidatus Nanopelagicaceae bacterium]